MKTVNKQGAVTFINMGLSIIAGTLFGLTFGWVNLPNTIVCGAVAIISTVCEHYLTINKHYIENFLEQLVDSEDETKAE